MNLPEPTTKNFSNLMNDVFTGKLKIPQFQREYVWSMQKSAKLLDSIVVTIQVPDYYHELVMAGPVRSDILARILWRKTYHVLHIARRALTKSDQRAGAARAIRPQVESYAVTQMFLNMGGPIPVENMSQNGSSTMPNTASCTDMFCFSQVAVNV